MRFLVALLSLSLSVGTAQAQRPRPADLPPAERAALEQRFRQRFAEIVQARVGVSPAQMEQLQETNQRFDPRRRELFAQEREVRREMREALERPESAATQERVAALMERGLRVQRQRLDLVEEEQRALMAFLTPVQRAKYFGLQEQIRRRVDEMRHGRPDSVRSPRHDRPRSEPGRPGTSGRGDS